MTAANHIRPRLDELAEVRPAFVLSFSITTLRQVESHVR
jgi:hypothetical protein